VISEHLRERLVGVENPAAFDDRETLRTSRHRGLQQPGISRPLALGVNLHDGTHKIVPDKTSPLRLVNRLAGEFGGSLRSRTSNK
jgi:hypothetical protein